MNFKECQAIWDGAFLKMPRPQFSYFSFIVFLYPVLLPSNFLYCFIFLRGILNTAFLLIFLNAFLPTLFSAVPLMVTFDSFLQPEKASFPIFFTFFPMETDFSFLLFLNAFASIPVTLKVCPSIFTVAGTVTDFFPVLAGFTNVTSFFTELAVIF